MKAETRQLVRDRAKGLCEYCRIPQVYFEQRFHIEHIVARQHQGSDEEDNLCLACRLCNLHKGPNLSGVDPESGILTQLFNPRQQTWDDHFQVTNAGEVIGRSAVGRTTAYVLNMNSERRMRLRKAIRLLENE